MKNQFCFFALMSALLMTVGCAGIVNHTVIHANTQKTLLQAGFKPMPVTSHQQEMLQNLLPGKITTIQREGKTYFLYPDLEHHQILVGHNRQFMQYNQLVTQQLSPLTKGTTKMERYWVQAGMWDFY